MKHVPDLAVDVRAGGPLQDMDCRPMVPYAEPALAFLAALSKELLADPGTRQHPDVVAFAYWCRAANLSRLSREFDHRHSRVGRGLALHIPPANVPVNFAFSFAFGVLSGNANIVRLPEVAFPQIEMICNAISRLFDRPEHEQIARMNRIVRYPRDDAITGALSAAAQARVLWGGDRTIAHLRNLPSSPRCVDIAFSDRYSLCILDAVAVMQADEPAIEELVAGFYNDVYLLDQNACSSPHLVLWQGDENTVSAAMQRFWPALVRLLQVKYALQPIQAVDKYARLCEVAVEMPQAVSSVRHGNLVYRIQLNSLPADIEYHRGQYGFFYEYRTDDLECLAEIVGERYQTLTCFGVEREALARFVVDRRMTGIDRVVPVGKALDIGVIWDGYDIIGMLSRIVHLN